MFGRTNIRPVKNGLFNALPLGKTGSQKAVHRPGIEPGSPAWQASILPLDHAPMRTRRPGLPIPNYSPHGLCGRKATLNLNLTTAVIRLSTIKMRLKS